MQITTTRGRARLALIALFVVAIGMLALPAFGQQVPDPYTDPPPVVTPEVPTFPTFVSPAREGDPGLPVTGGDVATMFVAGIAAVGLGSILMLRGRTEAA